MSADDNQRSVGLTWRSWLILAALSSLSIERRKQLLLSHRLPQVFSQHTWKNDAICSLLSKVIYRRGELT